MVLIDKKNRRMFIIDVALPGDYHVRDNKAERISKYQDLASEISRMWNTKTRVIPLVVTSALGAEFLLTE